MNFKFLKHFPKAPAVIGNYPVVEEIFKFLTEAIFVFGRSFAVGKKMGRKMKHIEHLFYGGDVMRIVFFKLVAHN